MPRPHPPEFRQRAGRAGPVAREAVETDRCGSRDLRELCARLDREGRCRGRPPPGVTRDEHEELIALRRELRVAKMENEILKRAAAFSAQETVLSK